MNHIKWRNRMLEVAELVASWSKDGDRRVGAVITNCQYHILATGYNGYPSGLDDFDLNQKNMKTVHAELNAILKLQKPEAKMKMFVWGGFPCSQCAAAIIQRGITEVYCPDIDHKSKWFDSMLLANMMFEEARVSVRTY